MQLSNAVLLQSCAADEWKQSRPDGLAYYGKQGSPSLKKKLRPVTTGLIDPMQKLQKKNLTLSKAIMYSNTLTKRK